MFVWTIGGGLASLIALADGVVHTLLTISTLLPPVDPMWIWAGVNCTFPPVLMIVTWPEDVFV